MNDLENSLVGEPTFRLKQIKKALFSDLIENWDQATTLPKSLRKKLENVYRLPEIKLEKILKSKDSKTEKALFSLDDGQKIESVLMFHEDGRNTVCVSSQAGCAMGCQFCATGQGGFKRDLKDIEIAGQVLFFARELKKKNKKVTNAVFMGMGEPFLNYSNVLSAVRILNDKDGFNMGARHISISTCGITEGIKELAQDPLQVNLAISLHAPDNELRAKLMPINKNYPIEKILLATNDYIAKTKRKVMFEYLMIDGVNDSKEQAEKLAKIMKRPLYFINLISFNPIGHSQFKPSPGFKIKQFKEILETRGVAVTQRYRFGQEIEAACGQLASNNFQYEI